jgi:hypothetical protein
MHPIFWICFLFAVSVTAQVNVKCGSRDYFQPLIVKGQTSAHGEWPWFGAIFLKPNSFMCGSTLINEKFLLTGKIN